MTTIPTYELELELWTPARVEALKRLWANMTETTPTYRRCFFDQDESSHNYLVNQDRRQDWDDWLAQAPDGNDPDPEIAVRIDGVSAWTFENPRETTE